MKNQPKMDASTRVVVNTAVVYVKLLIGIAFGLFTTRLVLEALGETDYGVFILVGGVIGMLAILNSSMSNASMRFMAHSLGSNDPEKIKQTFNTTLHLHFVIGLLLILVMEIGGYFMFEFIINIPENRFIAAQVVFHSMVLTTFITIIAVPYDAVINAHENLIFLSSIDILGYILKLGLAIFLFFSPYDLLITYAIALLLIQTLLRLIKQVYSKRKYADCEVDFSRYRNEKLRKEILNFSWWNLFGSIASMTVTQMRSLILNVFFGVGINAAEGVSKTLSNQLNTVSSSMTRALNPQLVKSEGSGDRKKLIKLTILSTKFSSFLFSLFAIPVLFETPFLLNIWLKNVPDYSVPFVRLMIISLLIGKFTFEITNAFRAIGDIKKFQLTETLIIICTIPIVFVLFKNGYSPEFYFYVTIIVSLFIAANRLVLSKKIANMSPLYFLRKAILPVIPSITITFGVLLVLVCLVDESVIRTIFTFTIGMSIMTLVFWKSGLINEERIKLKSILQSLLLKLHKK